MNNMRAVINDASNLYNAQLHAFYKAVYEKELNVLLEKKDLRNIEAFINYLVNNNWIVFIYHSAKEKKEVAEWPETVKQKISFYQTITPRKPKGAKHD